MDAKCQARDRSPILADCRLVATIIATRRLLINLPSPPPLVWHDVDAAKLFSRRRRRESRPQRRRQQATRVNEAPSRCLHYVIMQAYQH